jgi:hypothetical protein
MTTARPAHARTVRTFLLLRARSQVTAPASASGRTVAVRTVTSVTEAVIPPRRRSRPHRLDPRQLGRHSICTKPGACRGQPLISVINVDAERSGQPACSAPAFRQFDVPDRFDPLDERIEDASRLAFELDRPGGVIRRRLAARESR